MLIVRGVNVFPSEIEDVVLEHAALGGQYVIVLDRRQALVSLEVRCELAEPGEPAQVADDIRHRLETRIRVRTDVVVLQPGELPRQEVGKARRVWERTCDEDPLV
jgi:phenylacetate-CoA ligase